MIFPALKRIALFSAFSALVITMVIVYPCAGAVTIVHSNDLMGDIEPCGCRSNPLGGVARKANFLRSLKDQALIQLDAGDSLFATMQIPELLQRQAETQAELLIRSLNELGHDAATPGEMDFALGFKAFEKLRKKARFRYLGANLRKKNGGKYLDEHTIIIRKGTDGKSVRVGVFGLVGSDLTWPPELKATPALVAAKAQVATLKGKADYIVALTHQGYDADRRLAESVPGIDIIIGGHSQSFLQVPAKVGSTWIYQSSFRNQYVGTIPLAKPLTAESYQLVGLDAGYDSPTDSPGPLDLTVKEFKAAIAELNSKEDIRLQAAATSTANAQQKYHTFPRCAECHSKQFEFWRKTQHARSLHSLVEKKQEKNKECLQCHTLALGEKTGYAHIDRIAEFKAHKSTLNNADKEEHDLSILSGIGIDAFLNAMIEAKTLKDPVLVSQSDTEPQPLEQALSAMKRSWAPVQCENCHQPGGDHPFSNDYAKKVKNTVCLGCHTAERAPDWYGKSGIPDWEKINAKHAKVSCPGGEPADLSGE